jgi:hypothetical protein
MTTASPVKPRPTCKHGEADRDWSNLYVPPGVNVEHLRRLAPHDLPAPLPPIVIRPEEFCLKKLKVHPDMSQETIAFSAEVWFRKKLIGFARNEGTGGSLCLHQAVPGSLKEAEAWAWAAAMPPESSYQRVYEAVACGEGVYADQTREDIQSDQRHTTTIVNLEALIDTIVERAAGRKGVRGLKSYLILGPRRGEPDKVPYLSKCKKPPTPAQITHAESMFMWVCPLVDVFDLPFHYYPAPHPFGGLGWPETKVVVGKRRGKVTYSNTNDHQVAVRFDDNSEETMIVDPEQVRLADEETA